VTLAGMLVFRGVSLWLLEGRSVGPFPASFQALSTGFVPDIFGLERPNGTALAVGLVAVLVIVWMGIRQRARNKSYGIEDEPASFFIARNVIVAGALFFVIYKLSTFRGLPNVLITMGILTVVYAFLTEQTTLGRRIYALGGNAKAAKLSGIPVERLTFLAFVNMGLLAALAGLIFAARLNTATPKAGFAVELDVIAAVFIGGASMSGGVGKIVGAVVGAFIMGVMNNGMSIMGIGIDYQQVIKGLVLLAAVIFDVYNKQKQA
jgi:putative multiple sugar transport system permease protein